MMAVALSKPFPLDGGRVGMGVKVSRADTTVRATVSTTVTPNPGPSPIKGEGNAEAKAGATHV